MNKFLVFLFFCTSFSSHADSLNDKRGWRRVSDPAIMSVTERQFSELPLRGKASNPQRNWSSGHWPKNKGGINYRWNAAVPTGFNLQSPTLAEARSMSEAELAALAPSEKWDIFNGRFNYPLKRVIDRYASPTAPDWHGICEGWAGAAMNHDEPAPVVVTSADGISVPFGSSDIKALLSWYYAREYDDAYAFMGQRCREGEDKERCKDDMNAGAFHLVLTNRLGMAGESFIADIVPQGEVWNHLAASYSTRVMATDIAPTDTAAAGTVMMVRMRTTVRYVLRTDASWTPVLGTPAQNNRSRVYTYYLELNSDGKVIGGEWLSRGRPDFLWLSKKAANFKGLFTRLPEVL